MTVFRKLILSTAAVATLAASATPALAHPWGYDGGYHGGWHHHGDGIGGALVGGLIVGGLVAAIASSADHGPRAPAGYGAAPEDRAADACAAAVEGDRGGRVDRITNVAPYLDGWRVEGIVATGARDARGYDRPDSFGCTVRYGRVEDIGYGSDYRWRR